MERHPLALAWDAGDHYASGPDAPRRRVNLQLQMAGHRMRVQLTLDEALHLSRQLVDAAVAVAASPEPRSAGRPVDDS